MRKLMYGLGILAAAAMFAATSPNTTAALDGSAHDFENGGGELTGEAEMCQPCHIPHGGDTASGAPLWSHDPTVATFTPYTSTSLNATVGQPNGISKLCLSCHDGTVGLDSYDSVASPNGLKMTGTANVGIDLRNDHPVSFTYDATLSSADGGLNDPSGLGAYLFSGKVECSSCHDVHNEAGEASLLRETNAGSALCLKCHNK